MMIDFCNTQRKSVIRVAFLLFTFLFLFGPAWSGEVLHQRISKAQVEQAGVFIKGQFVYALSYKDSTGLHWAIFSKYEKPNKTGRVEERELWFYYLTKQTSNSFSMAQQKLISVVCHDLDSDAQFLTDSIAVTDLNKNSIYELSFAYKSFCGGGVEPYDLTLLMKEGADNYEIKGTSTIAVSSTETMGGEKHIEKGLTLQKNSLFLNYLNNKWNKINAP